MISYYDIRAARSAMRALQNKPLRRRKLDIHFSIPKVCILLEIEQKVVVIRASHIFCLHYSCRVGRSQFWFHFAGILSKCFQIYTRVHPVDILRSSTRLLGTVVCMP